MTGIFRDIRRILWRDWDPIGCGVPEDEYDDYVPDVMRLLRAGESRATLEAHLRRATLEALCCRVDETRLSVAVDKLMALGVAKD